MEPQPSADDRRHIATAHGLNIDQYRARWNLPREHPLVAPG
jgi:predicted transcriptional regulator